ncbi:MAG: M1 family metallopeptidase [Thermoanaerobaculia bacterium]
MPAISRVTGVALATLLVGSAAHAARLPEHAAKVVDYDISVRLDGEKKELSGREHVVWRNPSTNPQDQVSEIWLHLYWNAFRNNLSTFHVESGGRLRGDEAEPDGWGSMDVTAMKLATGEDLLPGMTFVHPDDDNVNDRTVVRVPLPRAVPPGGEIALDIEFHSKIPKVFARAGYKDNFFAITQWFPKIGVFEPAGMRGRSESGWNCHQYHANSEFYADYGHFRVEMTVPDGFTVGATGSELSRKKNGDGTTTHVYEQGDVHDFGWSADPRFIEMHASFSATTDVTPGEYAATAKLLDRTLDEVRLRDVDIRLLLQPGHEPQAARYLAAAKLALKSFGLWYGAYPYPTLTLIDPAPGAGGASGVEYPTLIFCGTSYLFNYWPTAGINEAEIVTVHEFGHQFWYALVGNNEFEEAWLDEGFNTYSTAKAMDLGYGKEASLFSFLGLHLGNVEADRMENGNNRRYDKIDTFSWNFSRAQYPFNAYSRPALVLETLEGMLGTETMARVMRTYHERWRFAHPRGADFFAVAEEVSGEDLKDFFAQTVGGPGIFDPAVVDLSSEPATEPRGEISHDGKDVLVDEETASRRESAATAAGTRAFHSVVQLRQRGEVILPVEVELTFAGKPPERRVWDDGKRWARWVFDRPEKLLEVRIDPDGKFALDADRLNSTRRLEPDSGAARRLTSQFLFWLQQGMALLGQ